jgi:hypothetical protein
MPYRIGPVRPHVQAAAEEVGTLFDITRVIGVAARARESDHPLGLALDFMVPIDSEKGSRLADYVITNGERLGVKYVIWQQRIWQDGKWKGMKNRGSITANHRDHIHVSFNLSAGSDSAAIDWNPVDDVKAVADKVDDIWSVFVALGKITLWLNNPQNWIRIAAFVGGAALLLLGLRGLLNGD